MVERRETFEEADLVGGRSISRLRIGYLCAGGEGVGWGHVSRAGALLEGHAGDVTLFVRHGRVEVESWLRDAGLNTSIRAWDERSHPDSLARYDLLFVDDYDVPASWIGMVARRMPVVVVDDWMRSRVGVMALLNPNLGADPVDYPGSEVELWLCGVDYVFVRNEVRSRRRSHEWRDPAEELLITLGGSDPTNGTATLAAVLEGSSWVREGGRVTFVLGRSYRGPNPLHKGSPSEFKVLREPHDFLDRCLAADLVICGASVTSYEMACMGVPFLPVALVDNQQRIGKAWAKRGVGLGISIEDPGWASWAVKQAEQLLNASRIRRQYRRHAGGVVDGLGYERVLRRVERHLNKSSSWRGR